jgi:ribosomal protein S13
LARISGIDLPKSKRIEIALTYLYGIGRSTAQKILADTGIDFDTRTDKLTEAEVAKIREYIDKNLKVSASWILAVTAACGIVRACRSEVKEQRPMLVPVKGRLELLQVRRNRKQHTLEEQWQAQLNE